MKNFLQKSFGWWLRENCHRFSYPPQVVRRQKRFWQFKFQGITPALRGRIYRNTGKAQDGWLTLQVIWRGEEWDRVLDIDIRPTKNAAGKYYCRDCADYLENCEQYSDDCDKIREEIGPLQLYKSERQLWAEHCFERLLEWANANLIEDNRLVCYRTGHAITWVQIMDQHEEMKNEHSSESIPVVLVGTNTVST